MATAGHMTVQNLLRFCLLVLTPTLCLTMETNCLAYGNGNVAEMQNAGLPVCKLGVLPAAQSVFHLSCRFCIIQQCHSVYITASALSSVLMQNWSQRITFHGDYLVPLYDCTSVRLQFINQCFVQYAAVQCLQGCCSAAHLAHIFALLSVTPWVFVALEAFCALNTELCATAGLSILVLCKRNIQYCVSVTRST